MIDYDLTKIKALMFDVDGVLSAATIPMGPDGIPQRGLYIVIITGGNSAAVAKRYEGLGVREVHLGVSIKIDKYREVMQRLGLCDEEVLYMGDDIPDYELMQVCGLPCCPSDAAAEIQQVARYVSPCSGGNGCVRDVVEQVLRAKGLWNLDKTAFGW